MEELNEHISGIRRLMEEIKTEMYSISNPETAALDEYIKSLYLRMLSTVVQYENEPSEMQLSYLGRIHAGIQAENPMEDYMRMALDLSVEDVQEFIAYMKESRVRYYFSLEGILLVSMGNSKHENYQYLGELIELISVSKRELEYLSTVARSILEQNPEYYDKTKMIAPETMEGRMLIPYVGNYYAGAIIDTPNEKYYYTPNRNEDYHIEVPPSFRECKVTFKNLTFDLSRNLDFYGCETIEFQNCVFKGNEFSIRFSGCGCIRLSDCRFYEFSKYTFVEKHTEKLLISGCSFHNCVYHYNCSTDGRFKYEFTQGGVIHNGSEDAYKKGKPAVVISACEFKNCGEEIAMAFGYLPIIICDDKCEVKNSKFVNCWNYDSGIIIQDEFLFYDCCIVEGNEVINSAAIVGKR